jgi:hypothetical protein
VICAWQSGLGETQLAQDRGRPRRAQLVVFGNAREILDGRQVVQQGGADDAREGATTMVAFP